MSYIYRRSSELLAAVADSIDQDTLPLGKQWHSNNKVTSDEFFQMRKLIAVILRGFAKEDHQTQIEIMKLGTKSGFLSRSTHSELTDLDRMRVLLPKAASSFEYDIPPLDNEWLSKNDITRAERGSLMGIIKAVLRSFVKANENKQAEIILVGVMDIGPQALETVRNNLGQDRGSRRSPLRHIYSDRFNIKLSLSIMSESRGFPPETFLRNMNFSPAAPSRHVAEGLVGPEHYRGFHYAMDLFEACMLMAMDKPMHAALAHNKCVQPDDPEQNYYMLCIEFLPAGRSLFLRDISGKRLMLEVAKRLKAKFSASEFREGVDDAQAIFLEYQEGWRYLEDRAAP